MFKPLTTSDASTSAKKVLVYAHHGWGKTTQCKNYEERIGKGFIISGESGLSSIRSAAIDYLPFMSWDGEHDPVKGVFSFKGICKMIASPEFKAMGYKWIGVDSLTELSDHCFAHVQAEAKKNDPELKNGFKVWGDYAQMMLGACKWIRDLPMHVIVTALAKEESNDNGETDYWPMLKGAQVQKQLPGIFDCVLCGVRVTEKLPSGEMKVRRMIVTDEVKGWHGKVRDEKRRLQSVERTDNVAELLERMDMADDDYAKWLSAVKSAA